MAPTPTVDELIRRLEQLEREVADRHRQVSRLLESEQTYRSRQVSRLLESEQTYRSIFENAEILISVYDAEGICLLMNRKLAQLMGSSPEALIGKALHEMAPLASGRYAREVMAVIADGQARSFEERVVFSDGEHWLLSTAHPIRYRASDTVLCQIFSHDITERKRIEARLTLFKTAVDHASDAIGMATPDGAHWYQNQSFDRLFGSVGADPPASVYVDEALGRKVFAAARSGGQWEGEVEMFDRHGQVKNILLRAYAIKDPEGPVLGLVGTHTDITDRKQAEQKLRDREERLQTILLASPDPMVIYDFEGVPQYLNPAFTDVFGWTLEELAGRRIPFVPEDQRAITTAQIEKVYTSRATTRFETRRLTKDGRTLDVIVSAAVFRDAQGQPMGMTVNLTDITERKFLQTQFEQAQRMESLGTLAGGIAHDFNNLLMGIQGRTSLMAMELTPGHPFGVHVREIAAYVKSASDLTGQLLGFARGGKYEVKPLDINQLVQASLQMFARTKKELQIETDLQVLDVTVEADHRQLEQVLINVYVNAWQAMPDGGRLCIETRCVDLDAAFCRPHQVAAGAYVQVLIRDTGIGMDPSIQARIFDPFFTTKEKSRGTGLGLASAFGIVRNHNGFIMVDSAVGQGTTFGIYLPASARPVRHQVPAVERLAKGDETILLVDDEELVVDVGRHMLKKMGYTVLTASGGQEAIDLLAGDHPEVDLVILDLIMPGLDGGKTFERLRRIAPDLPVLLSSGYALDGQAEAVMKKGCQGFIQKPFTIEALSSKIRSVLAAAASADDLQHPLS